MTPHAHAWRLRLGTERNVVERTTPTTGGSWPRLPVMSRPARLILLAIPVAAIVIASASAWRMVHPASARSGHQPAQRRHANSTSLLKRRSSAAASEATITAAVAHFAALGKPIYCGSPAKPYVALTFDDGPGPYTPMALKQLGRAHVHATFFDVGRRVRDMPASELSQELLHGVIGDHTDTHPLLSTLSPSLTEREIAAARASILAASGHSPAVFRPPYGIYTAASTATARRLGMPTVLWNVDSGDSLGADWRKIGKTVVHGLQGGDIVLMHENRGQTERALRHFILPALYTDGMTPVTVPELLALDPPTASQLANGPRGCRSIMAMPLPPGTY